MAIGARGARGGVQKGERKHRALTLADAPPSTHHHHPHDDHNPPLVSPRMAARRRYNDLERRMSILSDQISQAEHEELAYYFVHPRHPPQHQHDDGRHWA